MRLPTEKTGCRPGVGSKATGPRGIVWRGNGAHLHFTIANSCFLEEEKLEVEKEGLAESLASAVLVTLRTGEIQEKRGPGMNARLASQTHPFLSNGETRF